MKDLSILRGVVWVAMTLAGAALSAKDIVIFQNGTGTPNVQFTRTEDGGIISEKGTPVAFEGDFDLSENLDFEVELENPNPTATLDFKLTLFDAKMANMRCDIMETNIVRVPPKSRKTFLIKYQGPLPKPEVQKKVFGMRHDPFGRSNYETVAEDFRHIKKVRVSLFFTSPNRKFILHKIVARDSSDRKYPAWYYMTEGEFFPFIDKYGQFKYTDWPNKIKSDADLEAARIAEASDIAKKPSPPDWDSFGGWATGPKFEATGHFYVKKVDGKWWLIDPLGNLFWSHGVVRVGYSCALTPIDGRRYFFEDLPNGDSELAQFYHTKDPLFETYHKARGIRQTYDFSAANIFRKYGKNWRKLFGEMCHKRLRSWGMNTIANGSLEEIFLMDKTPYIDRIEVGGDALSGEAGAWWPFRDPFGEAFRKSVRDNLSARKAQLDDPYCIGFFADNELLFGDETTLAKNVLKSPAFFAAKREFASFLKARYGGDIAKLNAAWNTRYGSWDAFVSSTKVPDSAKYADLAEFNSILVETYFKTIRDIIKEMAPHKLYMGCRFSGSNPRLLKAAAKYCDGVSFNIYLEDLDCFGTIHKLPENFDKPILIGEFHFGALDRGMLHPSLCARASQKDRASSYVRYVKSALKNPLVVGTHWHQFSDEPTAGRFDGENFQVGLTDVCDTPYAETIEAVSEMGYSLYKIRRSN